MNKFKVIFFLVVVTSYYLLRVTIVDAQVRPLVGRAGTTVSARIGEYYLSLSGYIAPYASIVLTSNGSVLRSVQADAQGNFYFSQVLVLSGLTHFCFDSVDVRRLGQSEACFTVPPITKDTSISNIFLPPTLGLYRTQIQAGSSALAYGYSMPGASVTVTINGKSYTVTADSTGYYQIYIPVATPGTYQLFAAAVYKGKPSEKPLKGATLTALGVTGQIAKTIGNWLNNLLRILFGLPFGPLWLALPVLILILILLKKLLRPGRLSPRPNLQESRSIFDKLFKEKKLHHWWMQGVGY